MVAGCVDGQRNGTWAPLAVARDGGSMGAMPNDPGLLPLLLWSAQLLLVAAAGARLAARLLPAAPVAVRVLAAVLLAEAIAATAVLLLGFAGLLRPSALAGMVAALALPCLLLPAKVLAPRAAESPPAGWLARLALGAAVAAAALFAARLLPHTPIDADSMWYHLPMVARWQQTGSLDVDPQLPLLARGYPGFRQSLLLFLSLPLQREHAALLGLVELPALALAVAAVAADRGAARPLAWTLAAVVPTVPGVQQAAAAQGNDLTLALAVTLAILFVGRWRRGGSSADALCAGLALGAAAATKYSGPVYALAVLLASRPWLPRGRGLVAASALLLAAPWYLRNLVQLGNPLFPAPVAVFGRELFPGILPPGFFESLGFDLGAVAAHGSWFLAEFGAVLPLALLLPLAIAVAPRARAAAGVAAPAEAVPRLDLLLLPPLFFVLFLLQPFNRFRYEPHYNLRYLLPWFAAALAAMAVALPRRARPALGVVLAAIAVQQAVASAGWVVAAVGAAAGVGAGRLPRPQWRWRWQPAALLLALPALALGGGAVDRWRARLCAHPYYGYPHSAEPGWGEVMAWVHRHVSGSRVLLHGSGYFFPLYGERLDNEVAVLPEGAGADEVLRAAVDGGFDYLVLVPVRQDAAAPRPALTDELLRRSPSLPVAHAAAGGAVLALRRR